jgi:hypothetical protein
MTALLLYAASSVLVIWVIVDVARRPSDAMTPVRKAAWIAGSVLGWFFFGLIGAVIAVVYLAGPRRGLNSSRS